MIEITVIQGDVLVEDRMKGYSEMAWDGMTLDEGGNYLIVTTPTSRADVTIDGKVVNLPPSSFMRIRGDRSWWERHKEQWSGDSKLFLGRLWARLARDPREQPGGSNASIGVRG